MGRPSKAVSILSKHLTIDEKENRLGNEMKLKGNADKIHPPDYLNENQIQLFNFIKHELKESEILSNLDVYLLSKCVIAIDRLQFIEEKVNRNPKLLLNSQFMSNKKNYDSDFFRCCNELSLSPQSRAKLANIKLQVEQNKNDPLLKVLSGESDDSVR